MESTIGAFNSTKQTFLFSDVRMYKLKQKSYGQIFLQTFLYSLHGNGFNALAGLLKGQLGIKDALFKTKNVS